MADIYNNMYIRIYGRVGVWVREREVGWVDGRMDGRTDRRTNGWKRGWVGGWMNLPLKDYYNILNLYHSNNCLFNLVFQ
jgi:hypothetical protein